MTLNEAASVLGVRLENMTESEVRRGFASTVRLAHPDTGGGNGSEGENLARAKQARDTLLKHLAAVESMGFTPCKVCHGYGTVRQRRVSIVTMQCSRCGGSGAEPDVSNSASSVRG